jgi:hypothetical protein
VQQEKIAPIVIAPQLSPIDKQNEMCDTSFQSMKVTWHSLKSAVLLALAVIWLFVCAYTNACHCAEHEVVGRTSTTTVCLCACHTAIGMILSHELCTSSGTGTASFDYAPPHGTVVTSDIFRPPLAHG